MTLTELFERGALGVVQCECDAVAGIVLVRRACVIGGQFQQSRRALQVAAPEIALAFVHLAADSLALPTAVIGVLHAKWWQWVGAAFQESGVQSAQFAHQYTDRPTVGDDVMRRDQQQVLLLGQAQQAATHQGVVFQIETCAGFFGGVVVRGCLGVGQCAQIDKAQWKAALRIGDALYRDVVFHRETGSQRLVPMHDTVQRAAQDQAVQCAAQANAAGHQIGELALGIEAVQEP